MSDLSIAAQEPSRAAFVSLSSLEQRSPTFQTSRATSGPRLPTAALEKPASGMTGVASTAGSEDLWPWGFPLTWNPTGQGLS